MEIEGLADRIIKLAVFPKESEKKTYLMPLREQGTLKSIVGEKEFTNHLRSISFQVVCQGKLASDIINMHPVITDFTPGIVPVWEFK